ncbi:hypothetical protein FACS1894172_16160 [Spirochaetia bacterium]|nr:hypothetical protein FACS1894172_16160 [Spirochaetia bacterium]
MSRLKQLREIVGLTQKEFAEKICLTQSMYSLLESDRKEMQERTIKIICSVFNISEQWLRNGIGEMFLLASSEGIPEKVLECMSVFESLSGSNQTAMLSLGKSLLEMQRSLETISKRLPAMAG